MSKYWSEITRKISPYVPGEQPNDKQYIKLNTNENPYPPSPRVIEAIRQAANADLKLYPDPTCRELRAAIAKAYQLEEEEIFIGNGSDEILAFSFPAFFDPGKQILFPDLTYSFYPVYAQLFNLDYKLIPLDEEFSIPIEQIPDDHHGLILANPNAPTGQYTSLLRIEALVKRSKGLVILDEAYIDFGGESASRLLSLYPNLLIIQTFSKSRSLAGLRLGFALGQKHLIEALNRIKNSFNSYTIDRLALRGGIAAIQDEDYFHQTRQRIIETRERITNHLRAMGFKVIDSKANFIFISHPCLAANQLWQDLKKQGVLVRYFKAPRIDNYLRVSIGSDEEMDTFIKVLEKILIA